MAIARFFKPKLTFQQAETLFRGLNLACGVVFATYLDNQINKKNSVSEKPTPNVRSPRMRY